MQEIADFDPYSTGVLDPLKHDYLVRQLDKFAAEAGIPPSFIVAPREQFLPLSEENDWLDNFRRHRIKGYVGLAYLGVNWSPTIETRMAAMVGVLTRNHILGRLLTVGELLTELRLDSEVRGTGLFLPNFCDGAPSDHKKAAISDLLLARFKLPKAQTVVAAPSLVRIGKVYGSFVRDHIAQHYMIIRGQSEDE